MKKQTRYILWCMALLILSVQTSGALLAQVAAYTYTNLSGQTLTPVPANATIHGTGTALDDQVFPNIALGFTFPLNGVNYTSASLNANGWLSFGGTLSYPGYAYYLPLRDGSGAAAVLAVLACDWRANADGRLVSFVTGTAPNRQFIVQWQNIGLFDIPNVVNFSMEVRLAETTGQITIVYGQFRSISLLASRSSQVGLRGSAANDFHVRYLAPNWAALAQSNQSNVVTRLSALQAENPQNTALRLTPPVAMPQTFAVSGVCRVSATGAPLAGVTVSAAGRTSVSDATGAFSINNLAPGSYTLTATRTGTTFANATVNVTITTSNVPGILFNALSGSITGTVRVDGQPRSGVTVSIGSNAVSTNVSGTYTFTGLANGTYTVTPSLGGVVFTPSNRTLTITSPSALAGQDFAGASANPPTYTITGRVTSVVSPTIGVSGVQISAGGGRTTLSGADGSYTLTGLPNGTYSLTATRQGLSFANNGMASVTVNNLNAVQNFTAQVGALTVTTNVSGQPRSGVSVAISGVQPSPVQTGSNGAVGVENLVPGTYILTPSLAGTVFTPAAATVNVAANARAMTVFNGAPMQAGTFTVSGRVLSSVDNSGVQGVTVSAAGRSATSDASGNYSIVGVPAGQTTVTASRPGFSFAGGGNVAQTVTASVSNVNFTALLGVIAGQITSAATALPNVTVQAVSANAGTYSGTSNTQGQYRIANVPTGVAFTLTPTLSEFTFMPASASVTIAAPATTLTQNFTAQTTNPIFSIGGRVTSSLDGSGVQGVTVSAAGRSAVSDASGNYTITQLANGNYTVTASRQGFTFANASQSATVNNQSLSAVNFTANLYRITGTVSVGGSVVSGVTVSDGTRSSTTTAAGVYTLNNVPNGTYTLTPNFSGTTFTPTTRSATVNGANLSGQDFAGAAAMMVSTGLEAPTLIAPANNTAALLFNRTSGDSYRMAWTPVQNAESYDIEFATNSAFTAFYNFSGFPATSTLAQRSFQASNFQPTAAGATIFWRVRGRNSTTVGPWSATGTFLAQSSPTFAELGTTAVNVSTTFSPLTNGFNFTNASADVGWSENQAVWSAAYRATIDYNTAPYSTYRQNSTDFNTKASLSAPNISPLWLDFEGGYGRFASMYVNNNGNRTPTTAATNAWNVGAWGGSCYGFAAASILNFAGIYSGGTPYQVPNGTPVRRLIHAHQSYQTFAYYNDADSPTRTIQKLRAALTSGARNQHPVIAIFDANIGGHAVVPYRISSNTSNPNAVIDSVFIYDMNYPSSTRQVITVNRNTNTWLYAEAALNAGQSSRAWSGSNGFYVYSDSRIERAVSSSNRPIVQDDGDDVEDEETALLTQGGTRNVEVYFDAPPATEAQPSVTLVAASGQTINNGKDPIGTNTIAGASPIIPLTGAATPDAQGVVGFTLPKELAGSFTVNYTATSPAAKNVLAFNSNERFAARAEWQAESTAGAQQAIVNTTQDAFGMKTTQARVPSLNLTLAKVDETGTAWENVVRVLNASMSAGDSLSGQLITNGDNIVLTRSSSSRTAMTYDISLSRGVGQTFTGLSIGARETQTYLVESWDNIQRSGVTMLADTNSDGKTDLVRVLRASIETSVQDKSTPNALMNAPSLEFRSYPNPASSTVTLEYTLERAGQVSVEVVNMLGQPVLTLVRGVQQAGRQVLNADVSVLPAGTYMYRIQTPTVRDVSIITIIR